MSESNVEQESIVSQLAYVSAALACMSEVPGYNGSVLAMDDTQRDKCEKIIDSVMEKLTASNATQPEGFVLVEEHWRSNIWYAAQMLQQSDSVIDRNEGYALEKMYHQMIAASQDGEQRNG
jgi:hypothetical protein